jgi:hypothetical protein
VKYKKDELPPLQRKNLVLKGNFSSKGGQSYVPLSYLGKSKKKQSMATISVGTHDAAIRKTFQFVKELAEIN